MSGLQGRETFFRLPRSSHSEACADVVLCWASVVAPLLMFRLFLLRRLAVVSLVVFAMRASAQSLEISPLAPLQLWHRADLRLGNAPTAANNFDPDVIRGDATITTPSGHTLAVPAFWYQDYTHQLVDGAETLTSHGNPEWRLRFTPTEAGEYTVTVAFALGNGAPLARASTRLAVAPAPLAAQHGWVQVAADHRYFETSDGHMLRLIGENVCWPHERGTFDYEDWFTAMQRSGQNFARLWMAPWWAGLEHSPETLTHYKLDAAWQLDRVFDLAEAHGLYLLFCFDHHGMYMVNDPAWGGGNNFWIKSNPYARENGGPCADPDDFFTSDAARKIYEKRLRYLIARYGANPNLLAWQFFNEIDNAYIPRSTLVATDVAAWHRDVGQWLRAHDPFHHLITTSLTGGSDRPEIWTLPELDFSIYHSYADPAPGRKAATLSADFFARYRKPVLIGEFGVSARDWARPLDPHLRGFRESLWSAALGGSAGTSMSWWWEDIHADRAYTLYAAMHTLLDKADWPNGNWAPAEIDTAGVPPTDLGEPIAGGEVFTADLALNSFRRILLSSEAAIANPLAAERSSEFLSGFLRGAKNPDQQRPLRAVAWFGQDARLVIHVDSVASAAELVIRVDGAEVSRELLGSPAALPPGQSRKIDREFTVSIPVGKHTIEIANPGADWVDLDHVRLEKVRTSTFAGGWTYGPETVGLRRGGRGIVYVCSPWVIYPAGALRYNAPLLDGQKITLRHWPDGHFQAMWFDPQTGRQIGLTVGTTKAGVLQLHVPEFAEDVVAIVRPQGVDHLASAN